MFNKIKQTIIINNCNEYKIINLQNNINDIIRDFINKNKNLKSLLFQFNYSLKIKF